MATHLELAAPSTEILKSTLQLKHNVDHRRKLRGHGPGALCSSSHKLSRVPDTVQGKCVGLDGRGLALQLAVECNEVGRVQGMHICGGEAVCRTKIILSNLYFGDVGNTKGRTDC